MRFSANLRDTQAVESFSKVVQILQKSHARSCIVRITPTDFSFIRRRLSAAHDTTWLEIKFIASEIFTNYKMSGIEPDSHNEIIFEVNVASLSQSLGCSDVNLVHLKLAKKDGVPHLKLELRNIGITHDIPVHLQPVRMWHLFETPKVGDPNVSVYMPTLKTLQKMISSIKTMGTKHVEIKANSKGELKMDAVLDQAKINVYINDLNPSIVTTGNSNVPQDADNDSMAQFYAVRVDIKEFSAFFNCIPNVFDKILMRIIDERVVNVVIKEAECQINYFIGGLCND